MKVIGYIVQIIKSGEVVGITPPREKKLATKASLPSNYGPDSGRQLVVSMRDGDIFTFRPMGRTKKQEVTIPILDVYALALRRKANTAHLEKARESKVKKSARREDAKVAFEHLQEGGSIAYTIQRLIENEEKGI